MLLTAAGVSDEKEMIKRQIAKYESHVISSPPAPTPPPNTVTSPGPFHSTLPLAALPFTRAVRLELSHATATRCGFVTSIPIMKSPPLQPILLNEVLGGHRRQTQRVRLVMGGSSQIDSTGGELFAADAHRHNESDSCSHACQKRPRKFCTEAGMRLLDELL